MKIKHLQLVTHTHSVTVNQMSSASSPFGPVRAGLTTLQRTDRDRQLTELLNSLESVVADLNSKSYTALDTLVIAIEGARVALSGSSPDTIGTEESML